MSHHCELMLNTVVALAVAAVTLASDPGYLLAAQIGQVQRYRVTAIARGARFSFSFFFFFIALEQKKCRSELQERLLPAAA